MPGSGLGLAIVRQAAEAHNGYAVAENASGGGALLRVSFGAPLRLVEEREPLQPA
jgi:two-component system sensor histidine kinase MprB